MKKVAFWLGAALILIAPAVAYVQTEEVSVASLALIAAVTFTVVTRLDDLVEVSFGPLKAKMRETLAEANATVEQLRGLAATMARVSLSDLMAGHFLGGMMLEKRLALRDEVIGNLQKLGATAAQLDHAEAEWRRGVNVLFHKAIASAVEQDAEAETGKRNLVIGIMEEHLKFHGWNVPPPADIERAFREHDYNPSDRVKRALADYLHYANTNQIRDRTLLDD